MFPATVATRGAGQKAPTLSRGNRLTVPGAAKSVPPRRYIVRCRLSLPARLLRLHGRLPVRRAMA